MSDCCWTAPTETRDRDARIAWEENFMVTVVVVAFVECFENDDDLFYEKKAVECQEFFLHL
jgi:hypothetical protein